MTAPPLPPAASPPASSAPRSKAAGFYDTLFPVGSPRRRFGPLILAGALGVCVLLVAKLTSKSPEQIKAAKVELEARTTGRLSVKSNRANTTIEATRIPAAGEAASDARKGSAEGASDQTLATLPPGKYTLTARSEGWPDLTQEVNVEAGRATEVSVSFKTGSLRVDSVPTGATVKMGATVLGKTPLTVPQLPPGELQLTLEYPLWPALPFKTTIAENVEAAETVRLPHGKLVVESTPGGATVLFGTRSIGQTPLTIERYQAGNTKLTLQAKDFPPMELAIAMEDHGEVKVSPVLAMALPELDPVTLLTAVWVATPADDPNRIAPPLQSLTDYPSRNGIVKNLHRKKLAETWLDKRYRFLASVKGYNRETGVIEFNEEKGTLARYRVVAKLSAAARTDKDLPAQLGKGAVFTLVGYLTAVEEPAWPARVITIEFSEAEPLR